MGNWYERSSDQYGNSLIVGCDIYENIKHGET